MTKDTIYHDFIKKLSLMPDNEEKVKAIIDFVTVYGDTFGSELLKLVDQGKAISERIGYQAGVIYCDLNRTFFEAMTLGSKSVTTLLEPKEVRAHLDQLKQDDEMYCFGLNLLAFFHWFRGEYEIGFNTIFESINYFNRKKVRGHGWLYFALAVFYFDTKDNENSAINYQKGLDLFSESGELYGQARCRNGLASIALRRGELDLAEEHLTFALGVFKELGQLSGLSRTFNDLGLLLKGRKRYTEAIEQLKESIVNRTLLNHIQGLATSYTELGEIYLEMKLYSEAGVALNQALENSIKAGSKQKEARVNALLYQLYKSIGQIDKALEAYENHHNLREQLLSDEASNNIKRIQTQFEKESAEKMAELERVKNKELNVAYAEIEQKNKDIIDSLNYARRIQRSILPSKETLDACFAEYFVYYQPKDIVSGDFYWAVRSKNNATGNPLSIIATVDCTGHGVPGAFMSMLSNTLLNQTILNPKVVSPGDVLDFLNEELPKNLRSQEDEGQIRDGMDMSLCIFDIKDMCVHFSGANNPAWVVRGGECIELKADKQAVSASADGIKYPFSTVTFMLQKGDMVFMFTDGYADQFGGPRGKKFKYKPLKELLVKNSKLPVSVQRETLHNEFLKWKGEAEQVDDVCIVGIRV